MKSKIGLLIAILLLGYGIIRIGVGSALLAQTLQIVNISDLNEASLEVKQFIDIRADKQIITFTLTGYFAYILAMGLFLSLGAAGTILRKIWGLVLLWIYIAGHAALFINFQEINPKLIGLALQVFLVLALACLRPVKP
jgi:hypothetical protein